MTRHGIRTLAAIPVLAIALAGCGAGAGAPSANRPAVLATNAPSVPKLNVPAPAKPILTLLGGISVNNGPAKLDLDLSALATLPQKTISVYEPFLKARRSYSGVLMSDLLAASGVGASAKKVHLVALDDYAVDLDVSVLNAGDVLLASREEGKEIPIAEGGPIRIIFADGLPQAKITDLWIWSVRTMEIF